MFEKLITGAISLASLLLGNYTGNSPRFGQAYLEYISGHPYVRTTLLEAFTNDFETVFNSGKTINVYFDIQTRGNDGTRQQTFRHSVIYDPLTRSYSLYLEEQNLSCSTANYQQFLEWYSTIRFPVRAGEEERRVEVSIVSYLKEITLTGQSRRFDLNTLWKLKKPKLDLNLDLYEEN